MKSRVLHTARHPSKFSVKCREKTFSDILKCQTLSKAEFARLFPRDMFWHSNAPLRVSLDPSTSPPLSSGSGRGRAPNVVRQQSVTVDDP